MSVDSEDKKWGFKEAEDWRTPVAFCRIEQTKLTSIIQDLRQLAKQLENLQ